MRAAGASQSRLDYFMQDLDHEFDDSNIVLLDRRRRGSLVSN
ncbi:hypothetical protein BT93_D1192 [Corymbia citriodora subsp. variegata]|nr:hypothetical protein BT93_D1192 [Corymbia citriodora subsp. variegata]